MKTSQLVFSAYWLTDFYLLGEFSVNGSKFKWLLKNTTKVQIWTLEKTFNKKIQNILEDLSTIVKTIFQKKKSQKPCKLRVGALVLIKTPPAY